MSNLVWYICLAFCGIAMLVFTMCTKRNIKISTYITFYLFSTSITWTGELVALGLFNGYAYKPGLFTDPWAQNLVGHLILNSTLWPGVAVLVVAYSLGYGWISLIIAFYIFAEFLFVKLGIYEQHWWKYYMSIIVVVIFLNIAKKWYKKMNYSNSRLIRTTIFYFASFVIVHLPFPLLLLSHKQYYNVGWAKNLYLSSTLFIYTYQLVECFFVAIFVCIFKRWFWKLVPFIIAIVGQSILFKLNILVLQDGWKLIFTFFIYSICLSIFILVEKYSLKISLPK